jgi:hypothetical protein
MRAASAGDRPRVRFGNAQAPFRVARYSATDDARSTGENKIQTGGSEKTVTYPLTSATLMLVSMIFKERTELKLGA